MQMSIAVDQTLVSLAASAACAGLAYWGAARVLRRQERARGLQQRRDALQQVLAMLDGAAGEYLADDSLDYPQRDMVELERRALQAQILFWSDLGMQQALRDVNYPERHRDAAERLRAALAEVEREFTAARG